ncbi:MAG TPA: ATP-binding protein [Terriglobales bacterium]|jgi:serine/threonine-protein kinase RsbW|nr:ATP-binding protein [Terriglobales bacterium]
MSSHPTPGAGQAQPQTRLDISIPAEVSRIAEVVDKVVALTCQLHGQTGKEHEIALALTEALANAVKHGSENDPSRNVQCQVLAEGSSMIITVRDSGPGFNPGSVANPLESAGLTADHGRGLHMIRQLMDEVRFERNGAEIRMVKRF